MTRLDPRCAGGKRWHAWQVGEPELEVAVRRRAARSSSARRPARSSSMTRSTLRLLAEASGSSARSGCGRSRSSGARAPRGSARPGRARSRARCRAGSRSGGRSRGTRRPRRRPRHGGGDADGQTDRHARSSADLMRRSAPERPRHRGRRRPGAVNADLTATSGRGLTAWQVAVPADRAVSPPGVGSTVSRSAGRAPEPGTATCICRTAPGKEVDRWRCS